MLRERILAGVLAGVVGLPQAGWAFECPEPQVPSAEGVIPESQQEINELSTLLRSRDLENRLEVIARDLKREYPTADKTELTNFMVTAYCPVVVADQGLSESAKVERLDQFSGQVWQIYSNLGP